MGFFFYLENKHVRTQYHTNEICAVHSMANRAGSNGQVPLY